MAKRKEKLEVPKEETVTIDGLLQNAGQAEENLKAVFFKQQGVKEFLESLKKDGYKLVKDE